MTRPYREVYKDMHAAERNIVKVFSSHKPHGNKYVPHQGAKEKARRKARGLVH